MFLLSVCHFLKLPKEKCKKKNSCNMTTPQTTVSKTTAKIIKLWSAGLNKWWNKKKFSTDTGTNNKGETKSDDQEVAKKWNDDEGMKQRQSIHFNMFTQTSKFMYVQTTFILSDNVCHLNFQ